MSIFWDFTTQFLSRSQAHIPQEWELIYPFEEGACWNCGGEMTVERRSNYGGMEHKPCWLCGGVGAIPFSIDPVEFQVDWIEYPNIYNINYIRGESNLWEPF